LLVQRRAPLLHLRGRRRPVPRGANPPGRQHPHLAARRPDPAPGGPAAQGGGHPHRRVDALTVPTPPVGPSGQSSPRSRTGRNPVAQLLAAEAATASTASWSPTREGLVEPGV